MGKWKHSQEEYREMAERYTNGVSSCELAREYNISVVQVIRNIKLQGVKIRCMSMAKIGRPNYAKRIFRLDTENLICNAYQKGKTLPALANDFKTNTTLISRILNRNNIATRLNKETGKLKQYTSRWNGGVTYDSKGHRVFYIPDYPGSHHGCIAEHRYIMQEYLGRRLSSQEIVHHVNFVPDDNRIENLKIMTASEHSKLHNGKRFN